MRHAASRRLHAYWDCLRARRPAPDRDEVDPAAIRDILASVFTLDVDGLSRPGPGDARFHTSGTRVDALFGRRLRGSAFDRIWAAQNDGLLAAALRAVLGEGLAVLAAARGAPPGFDGIDVELLLLPLIPGGGPRGRVLGSLAFGSTPNWLGLSAAAPLQMLSLQTPPREPRRMGAARRAGAFTIHPGGRGGMTLAAAPL